MHPWGVDEALPKVGRFRHSLDRLKRPAFAKASSIPQRALDPVTSSSCLLKMKTRHGRIAGDIVQVHHYAGSLCHRPNLTVNPENHLFFTYYLEKTTSDLEVVALDIFDCMWE